MKAHEFDEAFDGGADLSGAIDWASARRPNVESTHIDIDFPAWVVEGLDRQAQRFGVSREALIKLWVAERLS